MRAGEAVSILAIRGTERQQFFLRLGNGWFDESLQLLAGGHAGMARGL